MEIIFESEYSGESLIDIEDDVYAAINESNVPIDENNFPTGKFTITIVWEPDDEE